jgi:hypothetical protein
MTQTNGETDGVRCLCGARMVRVKFLGRGLWRYGCFACTLRAWANATGDGHIMRASWESPPAEPAERHFTEPVYSPAWLRFLIRHWGELDDPAKRDDLAHEFARVRRLRPPAWCDCRADTFPRGVAAEIGRGPASVSGVPASIDKLAILAAYAELPRPWIARTVLHLLTLPDDREFTEDGLKDMKPAEFLARHRRRLTAETFLSDPRPQDAEWEPCRWYGEYPDLGDVLDGPMWQRLARILNAPRQGDERAA